MIMRLDGEGLHNAISEGFYDFSTSLILACFLLINGSKSLSRSTITGYFFGSSCG